MKKAGCIRFTESVRIPKSFRVDFQANDGICLSREANTYFMIIALGIPEFHIRFVTFRHLFFEVVDQYRFFCGSKRIISHQTE